MVGTVKTWVRLAACKECGTVKARPIKPHQRGERLKGYLHCSVCGKHTLQVDFGMEVEAEVPVTALEHKKEVDMYRFLGELAIVITAIICFCFNKVLGG